MASANIPATQGKTAYFKFTSTIGTIGADTTALIAFMMEHIDEIMFNSSWNEDTFQYDYSAFPVWSMANGERGNGIALNDIGITVPSGTGGHGIQDSAGILNEGNPDSTPINICCWVWYTLYPDQTETLTKVISRIQYNFNFSGGLILVNSASLIANWYNAGMAIYPNPPAPTPQFIQNLDTIPAPIDKDGPHVGQVLQPPVAPFLGIFTINNAPVNPFNIVGEIFQSN